MNLRSNTKSIIRWSFLLAIGLWMGYLVGQKQFYHTSDLTLRSATHKLSDILGYIQHEYVDSTDLPNLTETAIAALLEQLDPHSYYVSAQDQSLMSADLAGEFEGIGIEFVLLHDTIYVIAPVSGGPAEKAGIQAGDKIIKVDGQVWAGQGIKPMDILTQLRGAKGTQVTVSVQRDNYEGLLDFTLIRDKIPTNSIDASYMADQEIGYIKLSQFTSHTYQEFMTALDELKKQGMSKLLLDLRGNLGGYLDQAIRIAEQMLEAGKLIVYTQGKAQTYNTEYYARGKSSFKHIPVIILLNEGSASASEVLAGALQDHDRALIVGRRSFGKGLVQRPIQLQDGSELRLTVARYYTPSGRFIQKPYNDEATEYELDLLARYARGEYFHADSMQFDDSLQYKTAKGRTVYGGGGIMPDYFVALDTTQYNTYLDQLLAKYVLQQYALAYAHENKNTLAGMKYEDYYHQFAVTEPMLKQLTAQAKAAGIAYDDKAFHIVRPRLRRLLKAYIARNIWREQGFYPILNQDDKVYQKAIQLFDQAAALIQDNISLKAAQARKTLSPRPASTPKHGRNKL